MKKLFTGVVLLLLLNSCVLNPTLEEQEQSKAILVEIDSLHSQMEAELKEMQRIRLAIIEQDSTVKRILLEQSKVEN